MYRAERDGRESTILEGDGELRAAVVIVDALAAWMAAVDTASDDAIALVAQVGAGLAVVQADMEVYRSKPGGDEIDQFSFEPTTDSIVGLAVNAYRSTPDKFAPYIAEASKMTADTFFPPIVD